MEKYPRCPNNYHRNKKTKLCEPTKKKKETAILKTSPIITNNTPTKSTPNSFTQKINRVNQTKQQQQGMMEMKHLIQQMKDKKQATPIKGSPTRSKSNSFTQKINRVNQNKQQEQGMMEMKHLIQQMKEKKQAPPIKGSPTKSNPNSFTQKINRVNQTKQQQQGMMEMKHLIRQLSQETNSNVNKTNKNITEWVENLFTMNAEIQKQTTHNLQDKISQLAKQMDENHDKTDETITEWVEELIATNAEIQKQTADNLERKIAELSVNVDETLDKLTKQIYTYIEVSNEENENNLDYVKNVLKENKKMIDDTIVKNKTELKEEMKQLEDDQHKDTDWIEKIFAEINRGQQQTKEDLHDLSKQVNFLQTQFQHFRNNSDVVNNLETSNKVLKNKDTPVPSPTLYSIVPDEDKWEVENKTKGPNQSPTKSQGRTRNGSPNLFSSPILSIKSSHHSENKTNLHSISRKNVRFTLKNKRSTNLKKGKRRTAKKNNTK